MRSNTAMSPAFSRGAPVIGKDYTKDAGGADDLTKEDGIKRVTEQLSTALDGIKKHQEKYEEHAKAIDELKKSVNDKGEADGELQKKLEEHGEQLADALKKFSGFEDMAEELKKQLDSPIHQGGKELEDSDTKAAIEMQQNKFLYDDGKAADFVPDMDNLIDVKSLRSAIRKMVSRGGLESRSEIKRSLNSDEQKAFEAASLDAGFFLPQVLGFELNCDIVCSEMLDLYANATVNSTKFMFPHVQSYADIGQYDCDAKCDAEYGPDGNITYKFGNTYDWRGAFCFQKDTLREANYDLLGFMLESVQRAYRIARNAALISGDGVNEPLGWLTADCFPKVAAPSQNPTAQDLRQFWASFPVELGGDTVAAMHQNTFAYFASMVDKNDRFLFGDGLMSYSPADVRERIRISNCLPDPTNGGTRGSEDSPFVAGDFIMALADWNQAFSSVDHRPMSVEQFIGGSTMWCVQYQFGAKDGGFVKCCNAGRTLVAGAGS